jgi:hypothetical protein
MDVKKWALITDDRKKAEVAGIEFLSLVNWYF